MEPREPWMDICALASVEMDSKKLMALVAEVDSLLEEKERIAKGMRTPLPVFKSQNRSRAWASRWQRQGRVPAFSTWTLTGKARSGMLTLRRLSKCTQWSNVRGTLSQVSIGSRRSPMSRMTPKNICSGNLTVVKAKWRTGSDCPLLMDSSATFIQSARRELSASIPKEHRRYRNRKGHRTSLAIRLSRKETQGDSLP